MLYNARGGSGRQYLSGTTDRWIGWMFERYTERARRVLFFARYESQPAWE